jgi:DNA-binding XRE family transcriptional regulator
MNAFDQLVGRVEKRFVDSDDILVTVDEPVSREGVYVLAIASGDYLIEVEWQKHRGFGIAAGRDLAFGTGVDEVYGAGDSVFERIEQLLETGEPTSGEASVDLIDLRRLRGLLQKEVADRLGISKSGLAQMERADSLTTMQIDTLRKLVASLGGELVLSAHFPEGHERRIAFD